MQKIYYPKKEDWEKIARRPLQNKADLHTLVTEVFEEVKQFGDTALRKYTLQFDGVEIDQLKLSPEEQGAGNAKISKELKNAILRASENIERFHRAQQLPVKRIETIPGVTCWQESRAIESVGIYIPGGSAPLFSTVLMLGIPAKIAGCKQIVLCTPPDKKGDIHPAILYAAQSIGVDLIFKVGGIQAIAAMTFGTETVAPVCKIFGPGNQYVTAAKQMAMNEGIAIDMPAGPSELLVLADESCNPAFVASDLLSQAEHGIDSQVIAVVNNERTLLKIAQEVEKQITVLTRKKIASQAIEKSRLLLIKNPEEALAFINLYAPEHLIIAVKDEAFFIRNIQNAGAVFIGNYTPESAGDYASGTNHTLPTNGFAKTHSGVNLGSFIKKITFQKITSEGIKNLGKTIEIMAENEGLQAHKNAVSLRLNN